jgi:hypothetical protein
MSGHVAETDISLFAGPNSITFVALKGSLYATQRNKSFNLKRHELLVSLIQVLYIVP